MRVMRVTLNCDVHVDLGRPHEKGVFSVTRVVKAGTVCEVVEDKSDVLVVDTGTFQIRLLSGLTTPFNG